jgi:hypothetical protein
MSTRTQSPEQPLQATTQGRPQQPALEPCACSPASFTTPLVCCTTPTTHFAWSSLAQVPRLAPAARTAAVPCPQHHITMPAGSTKHSSKLRTHPLHADPHVCTSSQARAWPGAAARLPTCGLPMYKPQPHSHRERHHVQFLRSPATSAGATPSTMITQCSAASGMTARPSQTQPGQACQVASCMLPYCTRLITKLSAPARTAVLASK